MIPYMSRSPLEQVVTAYRAPRDDTPQLWEREGNREYIPRYAGVRAAYREKGRGDIPQPETSLGKGDTQTGGEVYQQRKPHLRTRTR